MRVTRIILASCIAVLTACTSTTKPGAIAIAASSSKNPAQTAALASQVATVLFILPNSREKESEADRMGLELMARAGYNPLAAVSVWQKMAIASQGKAAPPPFLSTHPSHANRIAELHSLQSVVRPLYEAAPKP